MGYNPSVHKTLAPSTLSPSTPSPGKKCRPLSIASTRMREVSTIGCRQRQSGSLSLGGTDTMWSFGDDESQLSHMPSVTTTRDPDLLEEKARTQQGFTTCTEISTSGSRIGSPMIEILIMAHVPLEKETLRYFAVAVTRLCQSFCAHQVVTSLHPALAVGRWASASSAF